MLALRAQSASHAFVGLDIVGYGFPLCAENNKIELTVRHRVASIIPARQEFSGHPEYRAFAAPFHYHRESTEKLGQ